MCSVSRCLLHNVTCTHTLVQKQSTMCIFPAVVTKWDVAALGKKTRCLTEFRPKYKQACEGTCTAGLHHVNKQLPTGTWAEKWSCTGYSFFFHVDFPNFVVSTQMECMESKSPFSFGEMTHFVKATDPVRGRIVKQQELFTCLLSHWLLHKSRGAPGRWDEDWCCRHWGLDNELLPGRTPACCLAH